MSAIKIFLFLLWVVLIPIFVGTFWSQRSKTHPGSLILAYFYGIFIEFMLFEFLAVPMVFMKCSLKMLSYTWLALTLIFAAVSVCLSYRLRKQKEKSSDTVMRRLKKCAASRFTPLLAVVIICILMQAAFVTFNQHIDDDDAFYVATAVTATETDSLMEYNPYNGNLYKRIPARYALSSWPLYLAALSTLCAGLHPTLIAHMLMPGLIVVFAYLIYALIARELFPADFHRRDLFMLLVVLVICFSGFSIYSSGVFLLIRGWQGKALIAGIIQPALFFICRRAMKQNDGREAWFHLFSVVTAACMFSSMGVVLSVIPVGVYALTYALTQKRWRNLPYAFLSCISAFMCGAVYLFL